MTSKKEIMRQLLKGVSWNEVASALGCNDTTVEFEITPNRPDCLSVVGLAREAAVTFDVPFKFHKPVVKGSGDDIHNYLSVRVDNPALCPRYRARGVKKGRIKPSPRWLRERLRLSREARLFSR